MEKVWLKSYPPGVPAEIDPTQYASVADLLQESFDKHRDKAAFACMGKEITYGELDSLSTRLAAWFQSKGIARGARIAIMMPNVLQYPVALAAILRAGYVVVNVNPLYTPRELEHQLKDSGAGTLRASLTLRRTARAAVRHSVAVSPKARSVSVAPSASSAPSLHGGPTNDRPTGRPRIRPIGTVRCG